MKPAPVLQLPEHLHPETTLALFEFFSEMTDFVWKKYETELVDQILREEINRTPPAQAEIEYFDDIEF